MKIMARFAGPFALAVSALIGLAPSAAADISAKIRVVDPCRIVWADIDAGVNPGVYSVSSWELGAQKPLNVHSFGFTSEKPTGSLDIAPPAKGQTLRIVAAIDVPFGASFFKLESKDVTCPA